MAFWSVLAVTDAISLAAIALSLRTIRQSRRNRRKAQP